MIRLDHLSRRFGETWAVRDVTLEVPAGTTLCLVGSSGSGKTTLLKLVNRLLEPTSGTVFVEGRPTREIDEVALRRSMGYVIQGAALFPHLTAEDNVGLVPRLLGWAPERRRQRAHELLEWVGLPPASYAARWPHQLSGGQQQRVGIARALASDPPIVLMDEPFGALDAVTRAELQGEQLRLRDELGKTTLLVTHDLAEALRLADHVGVLDHGELVQWARPDELLANPAAPAVARLIEAAAGVGESPPPAAAALMLAPAGERPAAAAISPELSLAETLERLFEAPELALPVVDDQGDWVGTITPESVVQALR